MNIDNIGEEILDFIKVGISNEVFFIEKNEETNLNNKITLERNYKTYLEEKLISEKSIVICLDKSFLSNCLRILLGETEERTEEDLIDYAKEFFEIITYNHVLSLSNNNISKYTYILSSEINLSDKLINLNEFHSICFSFNEKNFEILINPNAKIKDESLVSIIDQALEEIEEEEIHTLFSISEINLSTEEISEKMKKGVEYGESIFNDYFPKKENSLIDSVEEILEKTDGLDLKETIDFMLSEEVSKTKEEQSVLTPNLLSEIEEIVNSTNKVFEDINQYSENNPITSEHFLTKEKFDDIYNKNVLSGKEIDNLLDIAEEVDILNLENIENKMLSDEEIDKLLSFDDEEKDNEEENCSLNETELNSLIDLKLCNEIETNNPILEIMFNFNGMYLSRKDTEYMLSKAIILEEIKVPVYINFNGIMNRTSLSATMSKKGIINIQ